MSPTRPLLAATIAAIRRSDRSRVSGLTCPASQACRSMPKPAGSRVRAISPVRSCSPERASSHPGSGRITSPQTRRSSPAPRPRPWRSLAGSLPAAVSHPVAVSRQSAASAAPEAAQRSCHVPPGWPASQSSTCPRQRDRCRCPPRLSSRNGGASSSADACSLSRLAAGQLSGRSRGGNCRITCAPSGAAGPGGTRVKRTDGASAAGTPPLTAPPRRGPPASPPGSPRPCPEPPAALAVPCGHGTPLSR